MALQTLDPLALSATKLQAGGMDAQEVAYKRKAMEDDLAKTQLTLATKNKEIAQKQKEADQKLALMPTYDTLSQQHTKFAFEWMSKEKETRAAEELAYRQGLGGNPNDPTTPEGLARWNRTVNYGQIAANSKQMEDVGAKWTAAIDLHKEWYKPNAKDEIYKWQTSTEPLLTGEVANLPQTLFNLEGAVADVFGKIEKELEAGASADGTSNWSDEFIPSEAFLKTAELFATEPNAQYSLEQRFKELTPEKQAQIDADAIKFKTNRNTAMAMDAAKALYDRKREVRASEQLNEGGAGRRDDVKTASEFVRAVENVNKGTHQGFSRVLDAFPGLNATTANALISNNPELAAVIEMSPDGPVLKPGYELVKDFNRLVVGVVPEIKGKGTPERPIKVQAAIRAKNGNITVLTGTDEDFKAGNLKSSPPIPKEDVFQKVVYPALWNGGEYNPVTPAAMQGAMEEMGYGVKTETINQWNKNFIYKDPETQAPAQKSATTFIP